MRASELIARVELVCGELRADQKADVVEAAKDIGATACNCGFHTNVPYFEEFNFCPNCGAEMSDSQTLEDAAQDADAGAMAPVT